MKFLTIFLLLLSTGLISHDAMASSEVVPSLTIDGVTYEDVHWGLPANGKITFRHRRGAEFNVPLEKLPLKYQRQFKAQQGGSSGSRMEQYLREQESKRQAALEDQRRQQVVLEGRLVDKKRLTELVGFLRARSMDNEDQEPTNTVTLEVAVLRDTARHVAPHMRMRPGFWEPTGEEFVLRNYDLTTRLPGELVKIYGREKEPMWGLRSFMVGTELSELEDAPLR